MSQLFSNQIFLISDSICFGHLVNLKTLAVSKNLLRSFNARNNFKSNKNMNNLDLSGNQIKRVDALVFNDLDLVSVNLDNNELQFLPPYTFSSQKNLQVLKLNSNQIVSIYSTSFKDLASLRELEISGNKVIFIHPEAFRDAKQLQKLYLDKNCISMLFAGLFNHLVNLSDLKLDHNDLRGLDYHMFKNMKQLSSLNAEMNRFNQSVYNFSDAIKKSCGQVSNLVLEPWKASQS